jgi:hypothetical protein
MTVATPFAMRESYGLLVHELLLIFFPPLLSIAAASSKPYNEFSVILTYGYNLQLQTIWYIPSQIYEIGRHSQAQTDRSQ